MSALKVKRNHLTIFCRMILASILLSCVSCRHQEKDVLSNHETKVVRINPDSVTASLNLNQYAVDSVVSLSFPDGKTLHGVTKAVVKNDRIYIMDSDFDKTIYVFSSSGDFLFKAGERGRARNEYIDGPADFFVDKDENIHVFDCKAKKIVVFNKAGLVDHIVDVTQYFPNSFGMTINSKYLYEFNFEKLEGNTVLALCDENNHPKDKILHCSDTYRYNPSYQFFFANGDRLSHIPLMADSVLVFDGDNLDKIVKFDFGGRFVMYENPSLMTENVASSEISAYKGVRSLLSYQETDHLVLLSYIYNNSLVYFWLYNKNTQQVVLGNVLFEGLSPFHNYFLKDNQIISVLCDEGPFIDESDSSFDIEEYKKRYMMSSKQLQEIYDGKIKLPAVVYISILETSR